MIEKDVLRVDPEPRGVQRNAFPLDWDGPSATGIVKEVALGLTLNLAGLVAFEMDLSEDMAKVELLKSVPEDPHDISECVPKLEHLWPVTAGTHCNLDQGSGIAPLPYRRPELGQQSLSLGSTYQPR